MPIDEMMDVIEADQSDEDKVDGNDVIEKPRHDQNEYSGNEGDKRRDMGGGDDHGFSSGWGACDGDKMEGGVKPDGPGSRRTREGGLGSSRFLDIGNRLYVMPGRA